MTAFLGRPRRKNRGRPTHSCFFISSTLIYSRICFVFCMDKFKQKITELLSYADIEVNGNRPWDLQVHNEQLYRRVLTKGSLGLGESYMDGWWDADDLATMVDKIFRAQLDKKVQTFTMFFTVARAWLGNLQKPTRAYEIGKKHYDTGNDLYKIMLDKRLVYTCGYWKEAENLDEAQENKLDLVCRKIGLKKGMKVLDIGCGWGSFAKFAAEKYGAHVLGITVSHEQIALGKKMCEGLPVELEYMDYRDVSGQFDRIVSLGMFEHVGFKNYRTYMEVVNRVLSDDGLFLLHTIGGNYSAPNNDPWIEKYIFPNSMLPSIKQISAAAEKIFVMEDWHNFGFDYSKTLHVWYENFKKNWPQIKDKYDDRFYRMWTFYLQSCEGLFRSREGQLWQIVFSKNGVEGGYESIR